jgi:hypothetical protein
MQAHERLFDLIADEPQRSFGYPLCDAGWRDTLERLCGRIETALQENDTFKFVRIKQKFGVVRVDWDDEISNTLEPRFSRPSISGSPLGLHLRSRRSPLQLSRLVGDCLRRARGGRSRTRTAGLREYPLTPPGRRRAGHALRALRPGGRHLDRGVPEFARAGAIAMARFRCEVCGEEGTFVCYPAHKCRGAARSKSSSSSATRIAGRRPRLSKRRASVEEDRNED